MEGFVVDGPYKKYYGLEFRDMDRYLDRFEIADDYDLFMDIDQSTMFFLRPDRDMLEDSSLVLSRELSFAEFYSSDEFLPAVLARLENFMDYQEARQMLADAIYYYARTYRGYYGLFDMEKCISLLEKSMALGSFKAGADLGGIFISDGENRDFQRAFESYSFAAGGMDIGGLTGLGLMYSRGLYVDENENMAFDLWTRAFEGIEDAYDKDYPTLYRELADAYFYGKGCSKDYLQALEFYQKAELALAYKREKDQAGGKTCQDINQLLQELDFQIGLVRKKLETRNKR